METTTVNKALEYQRAVEWVKNGNPCIYQHGFTWKGAKQYVITQEEAERRLSENKQWQFGIGFYELRWTKFDGQEVLCFNQYSENDLL